MRKKIDLTSQVMHELKQVAKLWPKSLWLFAADGKLHVMRKTEDGKRAMTPNGGVDPAFIVDTIDIESDGGDW